MLIILWKYLNSQVRLLFWSHDFAPTLFVREINQVSVSLFSHLNTYDGYISYIYLSCIWLGFYTMRFTTQYDPTKDLNGIKSATSLLSQTKTTLFFYLYCDVNHLKSIFNCAYIMRHTKHTGKYVVNKLLLHY